MKVKIGSLTFDAFPELSARELQAVLWHTNAPDSSGQRVSVINTRVWYHAKINTDYCDIVSQSDYILADGYPIHKIMERKTRIKLSRMRGIDLMIDTLRFNIDRRHLFLGTNSDTLDKLRENLAVRDLLGTETSFLPLPYGDIENILKPELVEEIRQGQFDFIWVSLGAPKQDYASHVLHNACPQANIVGVGLVFDYLAGNVSQPPQIFVKYGLEWLYRVFTQTRRTKHFIKPFCIMLFYLTFNLGKVVKK